MKHTKIFLLLMAVVFMGLVGCQSTPIPGPMVGCFEGLSREDLTQTCKDPTPLRTGDTYERGMLTSSIEKAELYKCNAKVKTLQAAYANCQSKIDAYNKALQSIK